MITTDPATDLVASLTLRHQAMAVQTIEGMVPAEDRSRLAEDLVAAGHITPPGRARDTLRDMLYFWAGDQTSRGERPADASLPALAPFEEPPPPPPGETAASPERPIAGAAPSAQGELKTTRSSTTATGDPAGPASSAVPADAGSEVSSPAASAPSDAAIEREAHARAVLRLSALARQWRLTKDVETKRGYLLTGKALIEATLCRDDDPDIAALLTASEGEDEKATKLRRLIVRGFLLLGLLALLAVFGAGYLRYKAVIQEAALVKELAEQRANSQIAQAQDAITGSRQAQQQIQIDARRAIDALDQNDLKGLKTLLQKLGDASPDELTRLQLAPRAAESSFDAASLRAPQRTTSEIAAQVAGAQRKAADPDKSPTAAMQPPASMATCSGYLWFGSKDDSRLSDKRDPNLLKAGDTVVLDERHDIRLRADWPSASYALAPQNGLVPAGSTVTLAGPPRGFVRSSVQVWAPVTVPRAFCTSVFLQYVGSPAKRDAVLAALRTLSVQTPPADQVPNAKGLAEVRYFFAEDRPLAEQVAAALGSFSPTGTLKVVDLTGFPTKPTQGTIEVWMDLNG